MSMSDENSHASNHTPLFFDVSQDEGRKMFEDYKLAQEAKRRPLRLVDDLKEQLTEFSLLKSPALLKTGNPPQSEVTDNEGVWIVYPWRNIAVRSLPQPYFSDLRLSRNHDLITQSEQLTLLNATIAIAGLNVGNPAAVCLAQEGIGNVLRMADNDTLSLSNLNRFRAGLPDLGLNKAVLSARQVMEVNPYLKVTVISKGLDLINLPEFVKSASVLIEEMDHLPLKIAIRKEAQKHKIPVIMVTGNGHDIILDVERYDIDLDLAILNGMLTNEVQEKIKSGPVSFEDKIALARDFMGTKYLSDRLVSSFDKVGSSLIGIPQLAETTFLRGASLAHVTRGILLGEDIPSGRYAFGLSDLYTNRK